MNVDLNNTKQTLALADHVRNHLSLSVHLSRLSLTFNLLWFFRKRRKRRLNLEEFQRALLEQWAKHHNIPLNRVSNLLVTGRPPTASTLTSTAASTNGYHRNHRHIRSVRVQPIPNIPISMGMFLTILGNFQESCVILISFRHCR